jgi:phage terminase large subunit-like protein
VQAGTIVAGRAVRLACQRHLQDLDRQGSRSGYVWSVDAATHIIDFFPEFLTLESGDPFVLPPWLQFALGSTFGWKRAADGRRRFRYSYWETSKGSGKTPALGGVGLYGMTFDAEPFAEIYSAAFDKRQAAIALNDARRMAETSPVEDFRLKLDVTTYNIANPSNGSFFRAVSAEHRGKSGPRPHMVLGDELMEQRDGRVLNRLLAGFKGRPQPLAVLATNSGHDKTSVCWEYHQKALAVLEQTLTGDAADQFFGFVCHLDPCDNCYHEGYRQPKDGCEDCDDWMAPAVWPKVSPALGIVVQPSYQQEAIDAALTIPSEYNDKRRLNFCIWTESHRIWIAPDRWDACHVPSVSADNAGLRPCTMGLDPSSTRDLTAAVVALRHEDAPGAEAPEIEIEGMNELGQRLTMAFTLNYHVELVPFFWMPKDTLLERVRTERIPFDVWERAGKVRATPGGAIDHQQVYLDVLDLWKRFKVQRLGMDENAGRFLFMKLRDDGKLGDQVVSVGQGYKLSEAFKFIEMLIAHERLWHDGHPVLSWCFANAEPNPHPRTGAMAIEKPSETKRIDGVIAAAMAIHQLMAVPVKRKRMPFVALI